MSGHARREGAHLPLLDVHVEGTSGGHRAETHVALHLEEQLLTLLQVVVLAHVRATHEHYRQLRSMPAFILIGIF